LTGGLAVAATSMGLTACGGGSGGGGGSNGTTNLTFTYWSNPVRTKNTTEAIAAYMKANPKVKIAAQPGEFASYWDKLATQTAGNKAPDVIQMDMAYIAEYGKRGALLDLQKYGVDTSKFVEGSVDSGKIDGKLVGVNAGINTPTLLANPKVFEQAKMQVPDDKTWTWDSLRDLSAELTAKAGNGIVGMSPFVNEVFFNAYLRQHGKQLFTDNGLGFEAADVVPWFDLMLSYLKAKAFPSPSAITEEANKSLDQSLLATGKAAMQMQWSNQVEAMNKAASAEMLVLRYPSMTGKATDRKAWYKASMLWSASSRTKHPEEAGKLINWWVNSPECANINLAERGVPANTEILAAIKPKLSPGQAKVAKFIEDIKPELADTPIAPPPGGGKLNDILQRYQTDVLFGRSSSADAAAKFVDEAKSNLK
jgi:pectin-derived oligosaccharide transport system substrate-binding protein